MSEQIFSDCFGDQIVLSEAVNNVILQKHPEVIEFPSHIPDVLADPDTIRRSIRDPVTVLYYRYASEVLNGKWLVVVVKRIDKNFISTIYATDQIKAGDVLWIKPNTP